LADGLSSRLRDASVADIQGSRRRDAGCAVPDFMAIRLGTSGRLLRKIPTNMLISVNLDLIEDGLKERGG
jgi:hypothetical protein